ncbi:dihydrofolate reductase family protein [Aestuariivirga sp. YIM B02566]|uniref:Dihydrofolate reductase n=1 Tax=Taklimakanibacter albus TaxID=2800327 RepID=A0ACC5R262_9HYPH|nr:dihydrofolate reductase family protein [Aestuariivirga sp. YIM B02566]MBK1866741.1 dihydrofolate reductase [Aestuariivirga sp. YIM B02566]
MRRLVVSTFVSLDGIMQAPGGPEEDPTGGFKFGGWTEPYWDDGIAAVIDETFSKPFDLVLGRKTYDIFAAYWPYIPTDPKAPGYGELQAGIARLFNGAIKHVATRQSGPLAWVNSASLGGDVVAALRKLKAGDGPDLLIQGSSNLIQTLLAHDLIDALQLLIYPVLLGKGKRLFGSGTLPGAFAVTKSTISPSGVIIATYEQAGAVKVGSFVVNEPSTAELERRKKLTP